MGAKRVVSVDIDEFKNSLTLRICEDAEWNWTVDDLFEDVEIDGQIYKQLSYAGIDNIVSKSTDILEDLHYDQQPKRQPLESAAAVDFNSSRA